MSAKEGKHDYRAGEAAGADGRIQHKTLVWFDRGTNRGNGSKNVHQSGWLYTVGADAGTLDSLVHALARSAMNCRQHEMGKTWNTVISLRASQQRF
jgi:hypothetical protein